MIAPAHEQRKVQVWIHHQCPACPTGSPLVLVLLTIEERGGFWQPVTGHVNADETFEQAALREAEEETGLPFQQPPNPLGLEIRFESPRGPVRERVFSLAPSFRDPVTLDPREHVGYRWLPPEAAGKLLRFESNLNALKLLARDW